MAFSRTRDLWEKFKGIRSVRSFAWHFLNDTMWGQKLFLYNLKLPRIINISMNEKTCFFACKMCPYNEKQVRDMYKDKQEMSWETIKNLVASMPNDSVYTFDISAIGETLQFKELPEFIAYMKKHKPLINVTISTNGLLMSEKIFKKLADSGLDTIQFSLFAENEKDHKFITGHPNAFKKVCKNIQMCAELKKKWGIQKPFLQTFMMETKETTDKVKKFKEYWAKYVDEAYVRPVYNLGRKMHGMTPMFDRPDPKGRYPCVMPFYSCAVRSNGDVLACYMFHWYPETRGNTIGNINKNTMKEIWTSKEMTDFRTAHMEMKFPKKYKLCETCDLWDAYTNIWDKDPNGKYLYSPKVSDLLKKAPAHRGG